MTIRKIQNAIRKRIQNTVATSDSVEKNNFSSVVASYIFCQYSEVSLFSLEFCI